MGTYTDIMHNYPNILRLAKIALVTPVSTAVCERGFSRYNLIKTRACLKVSSVSRLMSIAVEGPELDDLDQFNFNLAFDIWCSMKQRRLLSQSQSAARNASKDFDTSASAEHLVTLPALAVRNVLRRLMDSVHLLAKYDKNIDVDY